MYQDMISENCKKYCCEDLSLIENYDEAINDDTQIWDCHHRLEIQGDLVFDINKLKMLGYYYNRPACELIFLTKNEHMKLHKKDKLISDEHKQKIREKLKGTKPWNTGKELSDEHKKSLSLALKGKKHRTYTKRK